MARNGTHSKDIENYFKENPRKAVRLSTLMKVAKCNKQSVSSAISYLNQKARTGKGGIHIEALRRGQLWAYYPDQQPTFGETSSGVPTTTTTVPLPNWAEVEQGLQKQAGVTDQTTFRYAGRIVDGANEGHFLLKGSNGRTYIAKEL